MEKNIIFCTDLPYIVKPLLDFFIHNNFNVYLYTKKPDKVEFKKLDPIIIISYSYSHIFSKEIIDEFSNRIINIHLSCLPYNKGYRPTVWSVVYHYILNYPMGVTIHKIDYDIDTGPILFQEKVRVNKYKDTLRSVWLKHHFTVQRLFLLNWDKIIKGNVKIKIQKKERNYNSKKKYKKFLEPIILKYG